MSQVSRRRLIKSAVAATSAALLADTPGLRALDHADLRQADSNSRPLQHGAQGSAPVKYLFSMVHHNPGEPQFITKYTDPLYLKSLGINGETVKVYLEAGITFDQFAPGMIPQESATWAWIQRNAHNLDHLVQIHKAKGMPLYPFTDVLVIPKELMNAYGSEMKDDRGRLSIQRPRTQEVMRAQVKGILTRFPEIDGLTIRFGETYLTEVPFHVGGSPVHTPEDHAILIRILRDEVCVRGNKKLIYRTWDFNILHTHPDQYLAATDQIAPHPNLIFSIKHTNDDFLRDVPLNKTLGIGKHQQIVEVSMMQAGCYGKGAYPYYLGRGVLHGWSEMSPPRGIDHLIREGKVCGIYVWPRGDGWSGPYISSELWVDLNMFVITQFGRRPWLNDEQLFHEYCKETLGLGAVSTKKLYELCALSAHATFIGTQSELFHIAPWWQRDDKLHDVDLRHVDGAKVLAEKASAVAEWRRIEKLASEIHMPRKTDQEYLQVSSTWGRIFFSIIEQLWTLQILDYGVRDDANKSAMRQHLERYDSLWEEWFALERKYPCCATLYMTSWPQTYPPTWREHPDDGHQVRTHDTPMVARCRATVAS